MTRVDAVLLRFTCKRCGAEPGKWCQDRHGARAKSLHASRFYQAQDAGAVPLPDRAPYR